VADAESAAAVYAAVDRLEPGHRETLHLHYYQGLTLEETAAALGIATSTVKYRVREALTQVQRDLARAEQPRNNPQPLSPSRRS
jgi:RNA polymerase sigma-70 factor (ECF subfamily)